MEEQDAGPTIPFIDEVLELDKFVEVGLEGFGYAHVMERVTDAIRGFAVRDGAASHPVADDKVYEKRKKRAQQLGEFARAEQKDGHRYLFGLAIVHLYSIVEAVVHATFSAAMARAKDADTPEVVLNLKGPLVPFLRASEGERLDILRERLLEQTGARHKPGLARFETLLQAIKFPSSVIPGSVFQAFLEFSESRHVIVHRNGLIDRKFLQRCPWITSVPTPLGAKVPVSYRAFHVFSQAAIWYLMDLQRRSGATSADFSTAADEVADLIERTLKPTRSSTPAEPLP